jgi:tRNA 2-thiouridine synthesizing protein A
MRSGSPVASTAASRYAGEVTIHSVTTVDARGLACPLPLTKAKRQMAGLQPGETLKVLATDPEASIDLAAWASDDGHAYEERAHDGFTEHVLVKALATGR